MSTQEDWITTSEAVKISGYHLDHIRRLLREGELMGRKWGSAWQVSRTSLMAYLSKIQTLGEKRGPKSEN
ncbi:MAG: helix-turn-helix domain-containing protein [Anaerolineales bacterium]|nr:helix-turn-helix domain-containing protein [Anaerolineales bacterium]